MITGSRNRSRSRSRSSSGSSDSRSPSPDDRRRRDRQHRGAEHRDRGAQTSSSSSSTSGPRAPASGFAVGRPGTTTVQLGRMAAPASKVLPVQMKLGASARPGRPADSGGAPRKLTVASAFANASDSDDDTPEEMPAECRMRMRNIGRDTPTSSGPNSFGKTKHGFCDAQKMREKSLAKKK